LIPEVKGTDRAGIINQRPNEDRQPNATLWRCCLLFESDVCRRPRKPPVRGRSPTRKTRSEVRDVVVGVLEGATVQGFLGQFVRLSP